MKKLVLIILTCLPVLIYSQTNLDSALVAYYPFSGNANDASGNGNDGTISGATLTVDRFGNPNSAYSFNGSNNYIFIPVDINYDTIPHLTMVAWVSPSDIPSNPRKAIISHDNGGYDREMCIDFRSGTTGYSAFKGSGVFGSFPATVGQWDMITVTYDQTASSVILYKDTTSMIGTTGFFSMGLNYTWIGGSPSYNRYFDGVIDEVRLYERILTDDEIMALFLEIYADFTVSDDLICAGDSVSFTDQSGANVTSWNWTFDGGTPGTSTLQNPSVAYNTMGTYNVQLVVSDGTYSDTLMKSEYIHVSAIPLQPNTPNGPVVTCEGGIYDYTTNPVAGATSYEWLIEPADAGTISGSGTTGAYTAASGWTGTYTVKARALNFCGLSAWSATFAANLNHSPLQYNFTGGGPYCEGMPGRELMLDSSETGVDYEVFLDEVSTGVILPGTGSALNFGFFTEVGLYTVTGYTASCSQLMIGQSYIFVQPLPGQPGTPTGPDEVCGSDTSEYIITSAPDADSLTWILSPIEAGTMVPGEESVEITWSPDYSGVAVLSVYGTNLCGDGPPSEELEITVLITPAPVISGPDSVFSGSIEIYMTDEYPGNTYEWEISGGTVISGAGTHQVDVEWGVPGSGYVMVTENNGICSTTTDQYEVIIDVLPAVGENDLQYIKIYPNPFKEILNIDLGAFKIMKDGIVRLINIQGNVIKSVKVTEGSENITINTSGVSSGLYYLQIIEDDRVTDERKILLVR